MTREQVAERGWGDRDARSLRARLRPMARRLREIGAAVHAEARLLGVTVSRDDVRLAFGVTAMPRPQDIAVGGMVKVPALARAFPNSGRAFNVLYLISSALPDGATAVARVAKRKGIAVVVNQNGVAYPGWYGPNCDEVNAPMADLLQLADHVLYQSAFCQMAADRFLGVRPRCPSEVLYNAADTTVFRPRARPATPLTLVLAGSQAKEYRVRVALDTLRCLTPQVPDARLIITGRLGWAPDAPAVALAWARAMGVADRVSFTGPYRQPDAPDVFRQAHILLHTKYNDPCPTTVIEAMACGLPIAYSATGGVPELVGPDAGVGVPGELRWDRDVPPDPAALAGAVLTIASRLETFSAAARQRAVERFDVSAWLARHLEVFQRLVTRGI